MLIFQPRTPLNNLSFCPTLRVAIPLFLKWTTIWVFLPPFCDSSSPLKAFFCIEICPLQSYPPQPASPALEGRDGRSIRHGPFLSQGFIFFENVSKSERKVFPMETGTMIAAIRGPLSEPCSQTACHESFGLILLLGRGV